MSEDVRETAAGEKGARTATVRTSHADAELVRAALAPDNTDSMDARVDGDALVCDIERETTGGLRSTVDDYVVNLQVADRIAARARTHRDGRADAGASGDGSATDTTDTHHNT